MHKKYNKIETYGLLGVITMLWSLLYTKIFFPDARIIRRPIDIRGKKFIHFGKNLTTGKGCRIEAIPFFSKKTMIRFGKDIEINDYVHIAAISSVIIGDNVLIASKVFISDIGHGTYSGNVQHDHPDVPPRDRPLTAKAVVIEDNVWIGESVSILPGVIIGKGTIVGANSVVSKSLPPYVIAVGAPARPIKKYNQITLKWEAIPEH